MGFKKKHHTKDNYSKTTKAHEHLFLYTWPILFRVKQSHDEKKISFAVFFA